MIKKIVFVLPLLFFCVNIHAEFFKFQYTQGDSYRILSTVSEDVFVNARFNHHAEIVNRIRVNITKTQNNSGVHEVTFVAAEESKAADGRQIFSWGEEYQSTFTRDEFGMYQIAPQFFMPVVRNIPTFPDRDVKIGESWIGKGEEAHDLRRSFDIKEPFRVNFTVNYKYIGNETINGVLLQKITAEYVMSFVNKNRPANPAADYPVNTNGKVTQTIYWNNQKGNMSFYTETFSIAMVTATGTRIEFRGVAKGEITEYESQNTVENLTNIEEQIQHLNIADTEVRSDENGITISLENIQFKPDSAILEESEKVKLQKLAPLLSQFKDNDLLISGHTALSGSAQNRQKISKERADAVASYLIELGVKDAHTVFTQGLGAEKPIAPNNSPEGMSKNRRVEITILDK